MSVEHLTKREREVLTLAIQGHRMKQIAETLGVTTDTIKAHMARARDRMGATTSNQACVMYDRATREQDQ